MTVRSTLMSLSLVLVSVLSLLALSEGATTAPPITIMDNRGPVAAALMESTFVAYAIDHPELKLESSIVAPRDLFKNLYSKVPVADFFVSGQSPDSVTDDDTLEVLKAANSEIVSFPIAASAIQPVYNLPGTTIPLLLSRQNVVDIMMGDITMWNDPKLVALNPGLQLPNQGIVVVIGVSYQTQTLSFATALNKFDPSVAAKVGGISDHVTWPLAKYSSYIINEDTHASVVVATPYSFSYALSATAYTLNAQKALMINKAGQVVASSETSLSATFLEMGAAPNAQGVQEWVQDLSDAAGNECWPMAFVIAVYLPKDTPRTTCAARVAVANFWMWALGSTVVKTMANTLHIVMVPPILYTTLDLGNFLANTLTCEGKATGVQQNFDLIRVGGIDVSSIYADFMSISLAYFGSIDPLKDYAFQTLQGIQSVTQLQSGEIDVAHIISSQLTQTDPGYLESIARSVHESENVIDALMDHDPNLSWTIPNAANPTDAAGSTSYSSGEVFHIPNSLYSVVPTYNIPTNVSNVYTNLPLVLDLETLGAIFSLQITHWDHPSIEALNPGLAAAFASTATDSTITLVVCCETNGTPQPLSNALTSVLNHSSKAFQNANSWTIPVDWDAIHSKALATGLPFWHLDFESQIESSVKRIPGSIGYKLASTELADPTRDLTIQLTTLPAGADPSTAIVSQVTASPDSLFACANAVLPSLDPSYHLHNLLVTETNKYYMSQCWPLNLVTSFIVPVDYTGSAACATANRTVDLVNWMVTASASDGPAIARGILRLHQVPGMQDMQNRALNAITCDGVTMLITLPVVWKLSQAITGVSWTLTALGWACVAVSAVLLFIYRHKSVLRSSSVPFQFVILVGLGLMFASIGIFGSVPTNSRCQSLVWLLNIGFTLTFGPLFAKMWRIYKIFDRKVLKVVKISNEKLGAGVAALVASDFVLNLIWQLYTPIRAEPFSTNVNGVEHDYVSCNGDANALPLLLVIVSLKFVMLVFGSYMGFTTRNVASTFNESKNVAWAIYNVFFSVAIIVPVIFFSGAVGDAFTILIVFLLFWISCGTMILNFGSKFLLLFTDEDAGHSSHHTNGSEGADAGIMEALFNFPQINNIPKASLDRYITNLENQIRVAKQKHQLMLEEGTVGATTGGAEKSNHQTSRLNQSQGGNNSQLGASQIMNTKGNTKQVTAIPRSQANSRAPSVGGMSTNVPPANTTGLRQVSKNAAPTATYGRSTPLTTNGFDMNFDGQDREESAALGEGPVFHRSTTPQLTADGSSPNAAHSAFRQTPSVEMVNNPGAVRGTTNPSNNKDEISISPVPGATTTTGSSSSSATAAAAVQRQKSFPNSDDVITVSRDGSGDSLPAAVAVHLDSAKGQGQVSVSSPSHSGVGGGVQREGRNSNSNSPPDSTRQVEHHKTQ